MKSKILLLSAILLSSAAFAQNTFPVSGSAGIGTVKPAASSLLDMESTTQGFLAPRMTLTQRDAINAPAKGLLIYQTNSSQGFYYYADSMWQPLAGNANAAWLLTGNSGTNTNNFLGTIDGNPLFLRVNNQKAGRIDFSTASANTSYGYLSSASVTSGNVNTAIGYNALTANTTGSRNTAVGFGALASNTIAFNNTAVGEAALASNTTGTSATSTGHWSLEANTTGSYVTADGGYALASNTTGSGNTAMGYDALIANTTANGNTADGDSALGSNSSGNLNTAAGFAALYFNTTGYANSATGENALYNNTTGLYNTADGGGALNKNITGVANTAIGFNANVDSGDFNNSSAIGSSSLITASNQVRIGNSNVTSIGGYKGWTNISDRRVKMNIKTNVPGLAFINLLKPVTYNLNLDVADKIIGAPVLKDDAGKIIQPSQEEIAARNVQQQVVCTGFIAQDVETSAKSVDYNFDGVDAPKNNKDLYGLRYSEFVVPLVKAVQELSTQNNALQSQINELKTQMQQMIANNANTSATAQNVMLSPGSLEQNTPNPYNQSTTIHYTLPQNFTSAMIIVTDNTGKALKQITVSGEGTGSVNIDAASLSAGTYNYTLLIDGAMIDTKKMVLVK